MKKTQITIERPLRSRSASIIWKLIATADGMSHWIAEDVKSEEKKLVFTWGKPGQEYETRQADVLEVVKNVSIKFRWEDEDDPDAYTEISLIKLGVTDEFAISIIDYSEKDDVEGMTYMWNHDLDRLQHKTGI